MFCHLLLFFLLLISSDSIAQNGSNPTGFIPVNEKTDLPVTQDFKKDIASSIRLYEASKKKKDMEAIYYYDQLNKATLLSLKNRKTTGIYPSGSADNSIHIPSLEFVQKTLDENTVLLSYHLSELELITLLISKNSFTYYKNPINPFFYQRIDSLCKILYNTSTIQRNHTSILAAELYTYLIAPVQKKFFS